MCSDSHMTHTTLPHVFCASYSTCCCPAHVCTLVWSDACNIYCVAQQFATIKYFTINNAQQYTPHRGPTCFVHSTAHAANQHTFVPLLGMILAAIIVCYNNLHLPGAPNGHHSHTRGLGAHMSSPITSVHVFRMPGNCWCRVHTW